MNGMNVLYIHTADNSYTLLKNVSRFTFSLVIMVLVYCFITIRANVAR